MFGNPLGGGFEDVPDVRTSVLSCIHPSSPPQMNRYFALTHADIVLANSLSRALQTDFQILTQMAQREEPQSSSIARRAMRAANEIMNTFQRTPGDEQNGELDKVLKQCREIGFEVLGRLDEANIAELAKEGATVGDDTQVWAIGHW